MKNAKFDQILIQRTELAEKIVRLLAESRTTCWEMEKIFELVRQHAVVNACPQEMQPVVRLVLSDGKEIARYLIDPGNRN